MTDFSSPRYLFQSEEMESETSIKNLEAQNAQVQVAILELAKGQQELKALIIKKKKKPKGSVGLSHLKRKIKIPVKKSKKPPIPEIVGDGEQGDNHSNQGSAEPSLSLQMKKIIILETNRMMTILAVGRTHESYGDTKNTWFRFQ